MTWPTPSKLALADLCVFPWSPLAPEWPERAPSDDASFGSAFHRAMECAAVVGLSPSILEQIASQHDLTPSDQTRLLGCAEHGVELLEALAEHMGPLRLRAAEVSILYDVTRDTAEVLDEPLARDQIPPGHIHGTIDLVEIDEDGHLELYDWKTGERSAGELAIKTDAQLRTYALMAARAFKKPSARVTLLHASESGIVPDSAELSPFDIACARAELVKTLAKVDAGGPPVPGRQCHAKYCPIHSRCPVTLRALAQVEAAVDAFELPMPAAIATADEARRTRIGLKMVEAALEERRAALRAFVDEHGPIEVAPGILWGRIELDGNERVEAETPGAVATIQELLGKEAADKALEVSTSKAALERGARVAAKARGIEGRGAVKQVLDPVMAKLREIGAIKQGAPQVRYDEIQAKKAKGEAA